MTDKKIGICIAGYGNFGKKLHGYLSRMDECEVKYLYHPDSAKSAQYGPLGTSDIERIWDDPELDAFVIATPNDRHVGFLGGLIFAGRHHVFVEKPMTASYGEALALRQVAQIFPKIFMVGHCQRREGVYRKAKELLGDGRVGKLVNVNFNFSHGGAFTIAPTDWRASIVRNELGPLAMLGSHCIDTIHYLFGEVSSVYAKLENVSGQIKSPDCSSVVMRLENGATVFLQNNYNVPSEKYCFISGTEGAIYIERDKIWLRTGRDTQDGKRFIPSEKQELAIAKIDPIEEELKEFLNAIQHGGKVETGYEEGLAVMRVLEACRRSATENTVQQLS